MNRVPGIGQSSASRQVFAPMTNTRTAGSFSAPFGAPLSQRSNQRSCRSSARLSASGPKSTSPVFLTHGMWM